MHCRGGEEIDGMVILVIRKVWKGRAEERKGKEWEENGRGDERKWMG